MVARRTRKTKEMLEMVVHVKGLEKKDGDQVYARVDHGRWLADCSNLACTGAELVTEGEEMLCASCGTVSLVVWPSDAGDIDRVLNKRLTDNQHWTPGETVDMLEAENRAH